MSTFSNTKIFEGATDKDAKKLLDYLITESAKDNRKRFLEFSVSETGVLSLGTAGNVQKKEHVA